MATKQQKQLKDILAKQMPNFRVAERPLVAPDSDTAGKADAISPSLEELRKKYLGGGTDTRSRGSSDAANGPVPDMIDDTEMAVVEPNNADVPGYRGGRKRVIVSRTKGTIIGSQG